MADRFYNRDRNRPYEADYSDEYYDEDFRSSGRYDRDFDYGRDYEMRNRDYYSSGEPGYGENRPYERNWRALNRGGYGAGANRRRLGQREEEFDTDYDRWNRGYFYGGGYGRSEDMERMGYGRNYGASRGLASGRYSSGFGSMDYGTDFDTDFDTGLDYDYDFDTTPTSWSYQEVWLIPGPFSGMGPQGYRRSDERILEDINERLTRHGRLNASDIHVQVNNGEVTFSGTVDSRQAKRYAEDIVESVPGVQDVHNELRVQKEQRNKQQNLPGQKIPIQQQASTPSQQEREGQQHT